MNERVEELATKLSNMANFIYNNAPDANAPPLSVSHTWLPALSPHQIANQLAALADELKEAVLDDIDQGEEALIRGFSASLEAASTNLLPGLFNGNAGTAVPHLIATINFIAAGISNLARWRTPDPASLPPALAKRLQKVHRDLHNLMPDVAQVELQVTTIKDAFNAAESLPTTLQELRAAQVELKSIERKSTELLGVIRANDANAKSLTSSLNSAEEEARGFARRCAEEYQFIVSTGLAAAFASRAIELKQSMRLWVGALCGSLVVGMLVGAWRLSEIGKIINSETAYDPSRLWFQMMLSVFSIGAPVWFAWMSTKQIGQRFRLAEDYAFKASVATAYEGYRRQAAQIDPELEKALFTSALARLDEPPLRFVESVTHGSPLHELANSRAAKALIEKSSEIIENVRPAKSSAAE
ncbi:hypothetical protein [Ensifer adhaerens]|uniref:Uncharacterized protein n=1 Tax=Ensifer adhaerens TaxID=106592 RepID=A0A9Q8YAK4_ENSAD|nr:hypothetical protein [Ensifer adhaerens]USJ24741.1 hypothetical protein NE863_07175 [Ensifer adhaerens]